MVLICHEPGEFARKGKSWYRVRWGQDQHASFELRRELCRWLSDRQLRLTRALPPRGERAVIRILGTFTVVEHETAQSLGAVQGRPVDDRTYGHRARAIACAASDGTMVLHVLRPRQEHLLQEQAATVRADHRSPNALSGKQMRAVPIDLAAYIEAQSKRRRRRAY